MSINNSAMVRYVSRARGSGCAIEKFNFLSGLDRGYLLFSEFVIYLKTAGAD